QFMGTIDYCAPEQIRGESAGPAADCYALAGVLFECLTGTVPFQGATETHTMTSVLTQPPPKASERRPGLPAAIDEVIAKGLSKDPAERPTPTAELIRAAGRALAGHEGGARIAPQAPLGGGQQTRAAATIPSPATPQSAPTVASTTPAAPAAPPAAPARTRGRGGLAAIVVVLAAAAIAGGFLAGRSGRKEKADTVAPPEALSAATAGHLQLKYPASWRVRGQPSKVPGVTFASSVSVAGDGGEVIVGEVPDAGGPTLFSPGLTAKLQGAAPDPDRVLLGDVEAYRYTGLKVDGAARPLTLFAAPTASSVATVVCRPDAPSPTFDRRCGQVAATLRVVGDDAIGFAPDPGYAQVLTSAFGSLKTAIAGPSARLRAAKTSEQQAAAARQLAQAYASAETALRKATVSPLTRDAHAAVLAALGRLATGYRDTAAAATGQKASAYARAGKDIRRADAALSSAVASFGKLGYKVNS
ncbi:MAG: serine/threonine kinase PknH, partial [Solirubrobacteraceae bacterium]|nr:serine/threonine kinase PknH [Solirubrobacteraceae bacterium]